MIVGAWALAFHGRPRHTGDLDIFVARDNENADKLMAVIQAFGFGQAGIKREDFMQADHVIQLGREPNRIDMESVESHSTKRGPAESRERLTIPPYLSLAATS